VRCAVRTSIDDGDGIQFGCVCTIAMVFAGKAPIHTPLFGSPAAGQGTSLTVPLASRTRNAASSSRLNPKRACSSNCQKIRSAAGSAAMSPCMRTGNASQAITSIPIAPPITTARIAQRRIKTPPDDD